MIKIKRVYDKPDTNDGVRILVDRLWPRGISKHAARIDQWLKEVAPTPELRAWFSHDPAKFQEFKKAYSRQLREKRAILNDIKRLARQHGIVSLLYAAKDPQCNNAVVLRDYLKQSVPGSKRTG